MSDVIEELRRVVAASPAPSEETIAAIRSRLAELASTEQATQRDRHALGLDRDPSHRSRARRAGRAWLGPIRGLSPTTRRVAAAVVIAIVLILVFVAPLPRLHFWGRGSTIAPAHNTKPPKKPNRPAPGNEFDQQRGTIVSSDGMPLARSVRVDGHWVRQFPHGKLFADVTGFFDVTAHAAPLGLEAEYYTYLAEHETAGSSGSSRSEATDNVVTTISSRLQQAAETALAGQTGGVIAIDPRTGAVLAMYANPTYDPNPLSTYNAQQANAYYKSLDPQSASSPLVNSATEDLHPPGSTFKIIDSAAIFDHAPSLATRVWAPTSRIVIPGTGHPGQHLQNFGGSACPPSGPAELPEIFTASCDTTFGLIALGLGARNLVNEAEAFGFNSVPPLDLPADVAASRIPAPLQITYPAALAISAIGQYDDAASALQMALVSAAVANGGVIMAPHLLGHVLDQHGQVVYSYKPHAWRTATSAATATNLAQLMLGPTNDYNGTTGGTLVGVLSRAILGGVYVGGMTGTAESTSSPNGCGNVDWVTAWGPALTKTAPSIAVTAWVIPPSTSCSATGAEYAGPVVQAMLRAAFGR